MPRVKHLFKTLPMSHPDSKHSLQTAPKATETETQGLSQVSQGQREMLIYDLEESWRDTESRRERKERCWQGTRVQTEAPETRRRQVREAMPVLHVLQGMQGG